MKIPGLKTLRLSAYWLRSWLVRGGLILGYHRIAEAQRDPYSLCVTSQHFAEQLEALAKHANPIRLQDLVQAIRGGDLPRRAVAVTFDDGYSDNLYEAKPLLEHYKIPATVFVATGYMGREFWWDELARILLTPASLPERLCLKVNSRTYEWSLGHSAESNRLESLLLQLYGLLQRLTDSERQRRIADLRAWSGVNSGAQPVCRAMTPDEILELAKGGLLEVGAHTQDHPVLATLSTADQQFEIQRSKARLEELLGQAVISFSYPNGSSSDETVRMVRDSGFMCACASANDIVWAGSDPLNLPRFWIPNWDGMTFSRWLARWLHG